MWNQVSSPPDSLFCAPRAIISSPVLNILQSACYILTPVVFCHFVVHAWPKQRPVQSQVGIFTWLFIQELQNGICQRLFITSSEDQG